MNQRKKCVHNIAGYLYRHHNFLLSCLSLCFPSRLDNISCKIKLIVLFLGGRRDVAEVTLFFLGGWGGYDAAPINP